MARALEDDEQRQEEMAMEAVRLGIEAEAFMNSTLGRYLVERADLDRAKAIRELIAVDPDNIKANTDLRNKIAVAENFKVWIGEIINSGQITTQNILENEAAE